MEAVLKRPALLAAAQLLAFWPVWRWYTLRLGTAGDEKWGLLALFAAALMWLPSGAWADSPAAARSLWPSVLLTLLYAASYAWLPPIFHGTSMRADPEADFDHPTVPESHPHLKRHVLYRLPRADWQARKRAAR